MWDGIYCTHTNRLGHMMEKKIGKLWFSYGRTAGFAVGFDISKYCIILDVGFWYVGIEF
tara:strand:+ start:715 stop:891 length:177 start_codon:yes stop_codon:yes gene_type:complete